MGYGCTSTLRKRNTKIKLVLVLTARCDYYKDSIAVLGDLWLGAFLPRQWPVLSHPPLPTAESATVYESPDNLRRYMGTSASGLSRNCNVRGEGGCSPNGAGGALLAAAHSSFQLKIEHVSCASVRAVCTGLSGEISALTFCELSGQRASNRSRGAFEPLRLRPGHIPLLKAPCPKPEQTARVGREVVSLECS